MAAANSDQREVGTDEVSGKHTNGVSAKIRGFLIYFFQSERLAAANREQEELLMRAEELALRGSECEETKKKDDAIEAFALFLSGLVDVKMVKLDSAASRSHDKENVGMQGDDDVCSHQCKEGCFVQRLVYRSSGKVVALGVPNGLLRMGYSMMEEEEEDEENQVDSVGHSLSQRHTESASTRIARVRRLGLLAYTSYNVLQSEQNGFDESRSKQSGVALLFVTLSKVFTLLRRHWYAAVFLGGMLVFSAANSLAVYLMLFRVGAESSWLMVLCAGLFGAEVFCVHYFVFHAG